MTKALLKKKWMKKKSIIFRDGDRS
jgi:hypothetical protein